MNESSANRYSTRYLFMRNDNEAVVFNGRNPEDAWENLCESFDNDSHYIRRYFDVSVNKQAISKGFDWLNNVIGSPLEAQYQDIHMGPVYKSI